MSSYIRIIYDRLDFIEFKQNLILLKQPQHKASVFFNLTLDDFLKIRDFTFEFESKDRTEFRVNGKEYGMIAEGDYGKLKFQGTRFLEFNRI